MFNEYLKTDIKLHKHLLSHIAENCRFQDRSDLSEVLAWLFHWGSIRASLQLHWGFIVAVLQIHWGFVPATTGDS